MNIFRCLHILVAKFFMESLLLVNLIIVQDAIFKFELNIIEFANNSFDEFF